MEIREITLNEGEEIVKYILENCTRYNDSIFRGQSNHEWEIESTLSRNSKNIQHITDIENYQMAIFKQSMLGITEIDLNKVDENILWSIGQHYGLFTPLIDWTKSPYIALFFALQDNNQKNEKGSIFCIHTDILEKEQSENRLTSIKIIKTLDHLNKRIISQNGIFTRIPLNQTLEKIINNENTKETELCYKIIFSTKNRNIILEKLESMNINKRTMFPDNHGAAMHSNDILTKSTDREVAKLIRGIL